jgi:hypothetical protein
MLAGWKAYNIKRIMAEDPRTDPALLSFSNVARVPGFNSVVEKIARMFTAEPEAVITCYKQ